MKNHSKDYSKFVLKDNYLRKHLTKIEYQQYISLKENDLYIEQDLANKLAKVILKWCKKFGVTQYKHSFFSLNGKTAGKTETFYTENEDGKVKLNFSGKQLLKCEVDCSSFPNGDVNATFNAKGCAMWDLSSPIFIKEDNNGVKTLYIPSTFCNKDGVALDEKTCLIRAGKVFNEELTKFLHYLGMVDVKKAFCNVGCEQEYFLIEQDVFDKRNDLIFTGRTLLGNDLLIKQEVKANYFHSNIKVEKFVRELSEKLLNSGIVVKAYHGEVAPRQQEIVQLFSPATVAVNQNMYLMEIMDEVAEKHGLKVLLHEKPFDYVNGSGKHNNISISTDTNVNLLDFNAVDEDIFLAVISAFISGIDKHYDLLRLSVASFANDQRLGGKEAPASVFSVFLGKELLNIIDRYFNNKDISTSIYDIEKFERNRTSPFAFTGNKFEFRMVGSSQNIAFSNAVLQTILADEFRIINAKLSKSVDVRKDLKEIIRNNIDDHIRIVYNGDCYSEAWKKRAEKLEIIDYKNSVDCFECLNLKKNIELFDRTRVLSNLELKVRYVTSLQKYIDEVSIETKSLIYMFKTDIFPCIESFLKEKSSYFDQLKADFEKFFEDIKDLQSNILQLQEIVDLKEKAEYSRDVILKKINEIKVLYNKIEEKFPFYLKDLPDLNQILLLD